MEEYTIIQFLNDYYTAQTLQEKQEVVTRGKEFGLFNNEAFMVVKEDGSLIQSVNKTNTKMMHEDKQNEVTTEKVLIANRDNKTIDDFVLNYQKFNMQLPEISDTCILFENSNKTIGSFTLDGTVLVKAWDMELNRYVLIRRRIRTPMFSTMLDAPAPQEGLNLDIAQMTSLDINLAQKIKEDREKANVVLDPMRPAHGGNIYYQDNVSNYSTEHVTLNQVGGTGVGLSINGQPVSQGVFGGSSERAFGTTGSNTGEHVEGVISCKKTCQTSSKAESGSAKHTLTNVKDAKYSNKPFTSVEEAKKNALEEIYPPYPPETKANNTPVGQIDGMNYVYFIGGAVCTSYTSGGGNGNLMADGRPCTNDGTLCAAHGMPFGTKVYMPAMKHINGTGIFEVADVGGPYFDFDLNTTKNVGKIMTDAYVLEWGTKKANYCFPLAMVYEHKYDRWYKDRSNDYSDAYFQYWGCFKTENLNVVP